MPFSLQDHVASWVANSSGQINAGWMYACTLMMALAFGVLVVSAISRNNALIADKWIILLAALLVLVCRLPTLSYGESNPDESQWLATVLTLKANPSLYIHDFYAYDFSRSLTIFPLWLMSLPGLQIDYGLAKLTAIVFFSLAMTAYFLLVKSIFDKPAAFLSTMIVAVYVATTTFFDYVAYNSEIPAITFLAFFLLFHRLSIENVKSKKYAFLAGLFALCAFFAKEQAIYIVILCGAFCLADYWINRRYGQAILFVAGGTSVVVTFLMPFMLFHKTHLLVDWLQLNFNYVHFSQGQSWSAKLHYLYLDNNAPYYLAPWIFCLLLLLFSSARQQLTKLVEHKAGALLLLGLFYISCLYTILFKNLFYEHYSIFLFIPAAAVIALSIYLINGFQRSHTTAVACGLFFLLIAIPGFDDVRDATSRVARQLATLPTKAHSLGLSTAILRHAHPGEKMLVWGWDCRLFVDTGLVRSSRYWYPSLLDPIYPESYRKKIIAGYQQDILDKKPAVIVELGYQGWGWLPNPIRSYPSLKRIVDANYVLVESANDYKIYRLK